MSSTDVMAVLAPGPFHKVRGVARVETQREHARRALSVSALLANAVLASLEHDERGAPVPSNGWHWSLSHCKSHVAACVHRARVGIDVEDRNDVRVEIIERVLSPIEIALFERRGEAGFLRAWTAKEAVLKEFGIGLAGLERCKIVEVPSDSALIAEFDGQRRRVWQHVKRDLVLAVSSADDAEVECRAWRDPLPDGASGPR